MNTNRRTAILVGVFYIIGTGAGILSVVFTGSLFGDPEYLVSVAANENKILFGALSILTMGFSLTMVPVLLFPIFKKYNEALALGAVVFRGPFEVIVNILQVVVCLLLLSLSQEFSAAGPAEVSWFQHMGTLLLKTDEWLAHILSIVFSLGALMIYWVFYKTKLIPRWLSVWGLLGGILYLVSPMAGLFGFEWGFLLIPLAVQEMVMALWLIIKGFNSVAIASLSGAEK